MKRKAKIAALAALVCLLVLLLAACSETPPKHPLVAKWTERAADGREQITFSFEAIGDAELYRWTWDDEENQLVQRDYYWGEYTVDDEAGTVALELENDAKDHISAVYAYQIDDKTLRLTGGERDYTLERAAENSAKVR